MLSFCPTSIANEGSKDGTLITPHNFAVECFTTKNSIKLQLTGWCCHSTGFIRKLIQAFFNYQSYLKEKPINELFPLIIIKEYTNVLQKCCIQVHSVKSGKSINTNLKNFDPKTMRCCYNYYFMHPYTHTCNKSNKFITGTLSSRYSV